MKVLFDHPEPFLLAHGGFQTQIENTRRALIDAGVEVEFLQWWNGQQKGDIIHFFGRPKADYIRQAHDQGFKVVIGELLSATGARSKRALLLQRLSTQFFRKFLPSTFTTRLAWESFRVADACCALTPWEAHLMSYLFGAPPERVHVVPNGVENIFFNSPPKSRGKFLVCVATITRIKRVVELAEAAILARVPIWIIGKPFAESDPYAQLFFGIAQQNSQFIRYEGPIQDRARLAEVYAVARGFVLLSAYESRSIAAEEAAAGECPLLLANLPWARTVFGVTARYCPLTQASATALHLRYFYDEAPTLPKPLRPKPWPEVGQQLKRIYETVMNGR